MRVRRGSRDVLAPRPVDERWTRVTLRTDDTLDAMTTVAGVLAQHHLGAFLGIWTLRLGWRFALQRARPDLQLLILRAREKRQPLEKRDCRPAMVLGYPVFPRGHAGHAHTLARDIEQPGRRPLTRSL